MTESPQAHTHEAKPGPRSVVVPSLSAKLDRLLALNGRNQKWLAGCVAVTEPAVSNWKHEGRLPALHAHALCRLLGIEFSLLIEDDLDQFTRRLTEAFAPGSGKLWNGFLKGAEANARPLRLIAEGGTPPDVSLRRVVASKPSRPNQPELERVYSRQQVWFAVEDRAMPAHVQGNDDVHVVLLVEDGYGLGCLSPTRRHARFSRNGNGWQVPAQEQGGFYLDEPFGRHSAVAVVLAAPAPPDIRESLQTERLVWAADRLASWIKHDTVPHAVFSKRFFVVPG